MRIGPALLSTLSCAAFTAAQQERPFHFEVVDQATGRGVPLVELTTVHDVTFVTDSAGIAAIGADELPELADTSVWFHVKSHGYQLAADGFGFRGVAVTLSPGGSQRIELTRDNIAERLYRVTGAGIYRDSVRIGRRPPLARPLANGGVLGQDSVVNAVYRGRMYWFWGDTNRANYPLGNFATTGATSRLPADGGLAPDVGVDLDYFVGDDGFARGMCPIQGPGPVWIDGVAVLDHEGKQLMLCHYMRIQDLGHAYEQGYAEWHDERATFVKVSEVPVDATLYLQGHAQRIEFDGETWLCGCNPFPIVRVRPTRADVLDPQRYEAFTCLVAGARFDAADPKLDRDAAGALRWGWKAGTDPVTPEHWAKLVAAGHVQKGEGRGELFDAATGDAIQAHGGSISWNAYRKQWIAIALQAFGRSALGEVWFATADAPTGPWSRAHRIVTHDRYSFYNVTEHPEFAGDGGRLVYFEGTYTKSFSGNEHATPRYDYNQIMYRLDLADPRLRDAPRGAGDEARR